MMYYSYTRHFIVKQEEHKGIHVSINIQPLGLGLPNPRANPNHPIL